MITIKRKNRTITVQANVDGDVSVLIGELAEGTSSIFSEILRDGMTEHEQEEFWNKYMNMCKEMTADKKERIKRNEPGIDRKVKMRRKLLWK